MISDLQEVFGFENSVTAELPPLLARIDTFKASYLEGMQTAGFDQSQLQSSEDTLRINNGTKEITISTDPVTGTVNEVSVYDGEFITEPGVAYDLVREKSRYLFAEKDGVVHLHSMVMKTPHSSRNDEVPSAEEALDSPKDLKELEDLFADVSVYVDSSVQTREKRILIAKAYQERLARQREPGIKKLGRKILKKLTIA